MSQSGKILHLYVEVRSVADEDGKELGRDLDGTDALMLHGPDILPQTQHGTGLSSRGSTPVSGTLHKGSTQSLSSNKSPSRHSVSFQLNPGDDARQPPARHRQSLPYDEIGQLLSILQSGSQGSNLVRARSSESETLYGRDPHLYGNLTAPPTPSGGRRTCDVSGEEEEGKRSVVTFSYIEKARIKSVERSRSLMCQREPENPFNRAVEERYMPSHLRKRLSDPMWFNSCESPGNSSSKLTYPAGASQATTQRGFPNLRRATLDSIAREATHRALEEFGSPQLRRRVAANSPDRGQSDQYCEQRRCRSWGGSPVVPRCARTLPNNTHLLDPEYSQASYGLPRSPATDQLSTHARQAYYTTSPARAQGISNQRMWQGDNSPRLPYKHGPALPSCKPTDIQHDIPTIIQPSTSQRLCHGPSESPRPPHKVNFSLASSPNKLEEGANQSSGRNSISPANISPANSPEMARKLAEEASMLSSVFMEARRSPSPTPSSTDTVRSDSPRLGYHTRESQFYAVFQSQSCAAQTCPESSASDQEHHWTKQEHSRLSSSSLPQRGSTCSAILARLHSAEKMSSSSSSSSIRDPQLERSDEPRKDSPILHRHQPPQYTGDDRSPGLERRQYDTRYDRGLKDSPDSHKRFNVGFNTDTPVSWTFQQQQWRKTQSSRDKENSNKEISVGRGASSVASSKEMKHAEGGPAGIRESKRRTNKELRAENILEAEQNSAVGLSPSSSGVTGSLGESTQHDRDCLSPETSSQSSQKSGDTGNDTSHIQTDSGLSLPGPSLHSQKIARAKWEFLFGTPSESHHGAKDTLEASTSPSSGSSGKSPTPTPPSSLPLRPMVQRRQRSKERLKEEPQRPASHNIQHIEVEVVTSSPSTTIGASPKSGIIRRTIKYSETDLDAVPMRCYRETDIDEVMLAEQEEVDSAFGSNRSVMGTFGNSSSSPLEGSVCPHTEGEEDEDLQDEEVVSWASVRMQGDKKRQHATQEEDEVFSRILRGPPERQSDSHGALKSPITVESPRRTSADGLDSFSRHFESIMESHRAKGTSYTSLDSVDLTSNTPPVFTFDLPTLTPEIQTQIRESARQIIELSFAPLAQSEPPSVSDSNISEATQVPPGESLSSVSEDDGIFTDNRDSEILDRTGSGTKASQRERPSRQVSESDPEVAERLALGNADVISNGNKADLQAAKRLAKRLYKLDGFRKSDVARHLSKNNEFSRMVAEEYLTFFNFSGMTLDQALRVFLKEFALMGETQERERVLSHFSKRYLQCNPNAIPSEDSVHTLTCAVMLLNTDLHGHNIGKRMSCAQFIGNLEGLNDGHDFPKDLLKALYNSIKNEKLQWTIDEEELRKSFSELADTRTDSASHTMKRVSSGGNPLFSVAQQSSAQVYKNGFLVRKVHADPDGKKTPRGKRGWKSFYAILKGLVLYLQKGEYRPDKQLSDEDLKNAVSIHHSLAMRAADYSKRPNVFYLRTADWRVFLFQAPNAEQMQSWITRINTVAAMFSAPPFPAAIGSQKKFSRPLLPGSNTKLTQVPNRPLSLIQEEQVQSHETRFRAVSSELQELRSVPTDRKVKGRDQEEQKQREEYLEFEKTRYGTYAMLLRAKIRMGETDLAAFESRLFDDGGLQRAHSSPTLPQDSSHASSTKEVSSSSSSSGSGGGGGSGGGERGERRGGGGGGGGSGVGKGSKKSKRSEGQRHSYRQAVKQ